MSAVTGLGEVTVVGSRRGFLAAGGLGVAAAVVSGPARAAAGQDRAGVRSPDAGAWRDLQRALGSGAALFRPGDAQHAALSSPFNTRYAAVRPAGIVSCASVADVQAAVGWAARHGVPLVPRSGGHSTAGHSSTTGLLVSVRRINTVGVTRAGGLSVGGGATNSDVYAARAAGLYFPGGRCPGVGVAGLTLGGGIGFNDRRWGLSCDNLLSTQVVLADGSVTWCDANRNADLFWACRGGAGGNFGINTHFTYTAQPVARQQATVFDISAGFTHAQRIVDTVQELLAADTAGAFDFRIRFTNPGTGTPPVLNLLGQYLGDETTLRRMFTPILATRPDRTFIEARTFWSAQDYLLIQATGIPSQTKSVVTRDWLSAGAVRTVTDWISNWTPAAPRNEAFVAFFAMGGAIDRTGTADTAYPHRGARYICELHTNWADQDPPSVAEASIAAANAFYPTLQRDLNSRSAYVNFPDNDLGQWQRAYYGDNYPRLLRIKDHYDPTLFFRHAQSIGTRP
ncbi:FAD-binding oxidoreductase [Streptomyces sp. NPDC127069]|uniref:FAD-binding oxidoreductase n=1 Tax=Streptomyces sp. NPDC127069 TaxID=3347128 RepID=UPI00365B2531